MQQALKHLIVVLGPTASGKSNLGVKIAQRFNGEVISADSMQIYRGLDIGTAKITKEEMGGIKHHLIDIRDPDESFSVSEYQKLARQKIEEIFQRQKTPVLVGGTGLYINSTLYNYYFADLADEQQSANNYWRKKYQELAQTQGNEALYQLLQKTDPASAERLHPNDVKRVIRALEYFQCHGQPISANNQALTTPQSVYPAYLIGLTMDRALLYERINQRVDIMLESGLENEVENLLKNGCSPQSQSMQGIGYRQIIEYLQGKCSREEAVANIKQETRRYAKRQLTWFRRTPQIHWQTAQDATKNPSLEHLFGELSALSLLNN